jgi:hypothetical protein
MPMRMAWSKSAFALSDPYRLVDELPITCIELGMLLDGLAAKKYLPAHIY